MLKILLFGLLFVPAVLSGAPAEPDYWEYMHNGTAYRIPAGATLFEDGSVRLESGESYCLIEEMGCAE